MLLQLAIDCFTLEEALDITEEVSDLVDIVEAGTPLILREGIDIHTLQDMTNPKPNIAIVGSYITASENRREAASTIKNSMK